MGMIPQELSGLGPRSVHLTGLQKLLRSGSRGKLLGGLLSGLSPAPGQTLPQCCCPESAGVGLGVQSMVEVAVPSSLPSIHW